MPTLTRTIVYEGPQEWLDACVDNSFVALKQELGDGRSITSTWSDRRAQTRAEMLTDETRMVRDDLRGGIRTRAGEPCPNAK